MEPFRIQIAQEALDDLDRRLASTRWPADHGGWERGIPVPYLQELARYWREEYDWRAAEAELNRYPQFLTTIDGTPVHLFHIRSPRPDAVPLLLTHGWPGSFVEFLDIIGPLTDPARHGSPDSPAFHLVIPTIPGFGFSQPLTPGWEPIRVAQAWDQLMDRLGYPRYLAQGGDAGAVISMQLGRAYPERVRGVHVNMLITFPPAEPDGLADFDQHDHARLQHMARFDAELSGYMKLQSTRPQSLAYGLTDSPVGQLAWIAERFKDWTDSHNAPEDAVDRDRLLTNVSLYWFTASAGSSAQFYFEGAEGMRLAASGAPLPPVTVPTAVAVFPHDIFLPIRRLASRDLPNIVQWSEFEAGGHFAALERPAELVQDIRSFVARLGDQHLPSEQR